MEKTNQMTMSDFIGRAESILSDMKSQREMYDKQLQMFKETIESSLLLHRERMADFEKKQNAQDSRWAALRNTVWVAISVLFIVVLSGGIALEAAVSEEEMTTFQQQIDDDYFDKIEVLRGMGIVIDGTYETMELNGADRVTSHEEKAKLKEAVVKEMMPEYATRGVKVE